jgi:predicted kinase
MSVKIRPDNRLIITVGYPRSGKSTWAMGTCIPTVSSDALRMALFGSLWSEAQEHLVLPLARTMVQTLFFAGHPRVVFDSISTTRALRDFWRPSPECPWTRTYHILETSAEVCKERAVESGDDYLVPVIDRLQSKYEPVEPCEEGPRFVMRRGEEDFVQETAEMRADHKELFHAILEQHEAGMRELRETGTYTGELSVGMILAIRDALELPV